MDKETSIIFKEKVIIIDTFRKGRPVIVRCIKHGKEWPEADSFEENGGKACKYCCENTTERVQEYLDTKELWMY